MRSYERNGVHVDQCTECRGTFLDRGELERLVDAENRWHDAPAAGPMTGQAPPPAAGSAGSLGAIVGEVLSQARTAEHPYGSSSSGQERERSFPDELLG